MTTDLPRAVTAVSGKMLLKSGATKVGRRSRRVNDNRRQIPVAFEINTLDVENRLDSVTCQKRLGFRQRRVRPDFFRRPAAVQPHRAFHVVPFAENVQFALNMILPGKEHGQPLPKLERLKEPLAFPVELFGTVFAALDQINFQFFEKPFEFGSELTTVVGNTGFDEDGREHANDGFQGFQDRLGPSFRPVQADVLTGDAVFFLGNFAMTTFLLSLAQRKRSSAGAIVQTAQRGNIPQASETALRTSEKTNINYGSSASRGGGA
jgi:hypothetical protein